MATYDVSVEADECVSAGKCVASAPGYFVFDDDELARVDSDGVKPDDETLLRVARACPSGAIHLFVDGTEVEL
jgi:ferredoxin